MACSSCMTLQLSPKPLTNSSLIVGQKSTCASFSLRSNFPHLEQRVKTYHVHNTWWEVRMKPYSSHLIDIACRCSCCWSPPTVPPNSTPEPWEKNQPSATEPWPNSTPESESLSQAPATQLWLMYWGDLGGDFEFHCIWRECWLA